MVSQISFKLCQLVQMFHITVSESMMYHDASSSKKTTNLNKSYMAGWIDRSIDRSIDKNTNVYSIMCNLEGM